MCDRTVAMLAIKVILEVGIVYICPKLSKLNGFFWNNKRQVFYYRWKLYTQKIK